MGSGCGCGGVLVFRGGVGWGGVWGVVVVCVGKKLNVLM